MTGGGLLLAGNTQKDGTRQAKMESPRNSNTNFEPKLRHFLWPGTNLFPLFKAAWSLNDPELSPPLAGDRFKDATVSLTDSLELEELDVVDGGSNLSDNLENNKNFLNETSLSQHHDKLNKNNNSNNN